MEEDRSEAIFIPGSIAGIRERDSRGTNTDLLRDFYVIAGALTIRSDLCQPARRSKAL
jgi:hypothetical protein